MKEYNIVHTTCSHCGQRNDQDKLFQGEQDPTACICETCIIDYSQIVKEKEDKENAEFLAVISQFKDKERALEINRKLLEIERLSPAAFRAACDYVHQLYIKVMERDNPEPPDIIA